MTRAHLALAIVGLVVAGSPSRAPLRAQTADRYQRTLQPWIEQLLQREHRPGLAIAAVEGNRVVYAQKARRLNAKLAKPAENFQRFVLAATAGFACFASHPACSDRIFGRATAPRYSGALRTESP